MSDTHSAIAPSTPRKSPTIDRPTRELRPSARLKAALDLMVFGAENDGVALGWLEATRAANYDVRSMRRELAKAHVQRYLREQKQVFRAAASAQNISALVKLRDDSGNAMAQLGAIKVLEQIDSDPQAQSSAVRSPGFVIVVNAGSQPADSAKPLIELHSEPRED